MTRANYHECLFFTCSRRHNELEENDDNDDDNDDDHDDDGHGHDGW